MRVFLHGDCHGDFSWLEDFYEEYQPTLDDVLILLGDVGLNYYENKTDIKNKRLLSQYPITFVCIHGNHEQRPRNISSYIITYSKHLNCNVWYEPQYPTILFPFDGKMIIDKKKFLVIGGAYSVDKYYRLSKGYKWFEDEQLNQDERRSLLNYIKFENNFDYVLTHTAPISLEPTFLFLPEVNQSTVDKTMEQFLEQVNNIISYKHWYFGHYHGDYELTPDVTLMYHKTIQIV